MEGDRRAGESVAKRPRTGEAPSVVDAHDAVTLHLVSATSPESIRTEISKGGACEPFKAEFLHQHFGDDEQIKGYRGIQINIWFHGSTYHAWVDVKYDKRRPGADKLDDIFKDKFPDGYSKTLEEFIAAVTASLGEMPARLADVGERVGAPLALGRGAGVSGTLVEGTGDEAVILRFKLADAPPSVKALHGRFDAMLPFFIDGAQFIDPDDPQWDLLLVAPTRPGANYVLGMTTIYDFWAFPDSRRLRVSQVFVPPPFQGCGIGKALLRAAYSIAQQRDVVDITVEDPTPNLQCVREKVEAEMMLKLDWVRAQVAQCMEAIGEGEVGPTTPASTSPQAPAAAVHDGATCGTSRPADTAAAAAAAAGVSGTAVADAISSEAAAGPASERGQKQGAAAAPAVFTMLLPPPAFFQRVTKELKTYRRQARQVWEVLLALQPSLLQDGSVSSALLRQLIRSRIEALPMFSASYFSTADKKALFPSAADARVFSMMRTDAFARMQGNIESARPGAVPMATAVPPAAPSNSVPSSATANGGAGTSGGGGGRFNPAEMDPVERDARINEMLEQRLAGLQLTARLLAKSQRHALH